MADKKIESLLHHLRRAVRDGSDGTATDGELLDRFRTQRDETAFEVLVWRHGTMVLRLCQRMLGDAHAAEDAFQATFLTLVRKAGTVGKREALAAWLHRVAYRVALHARVRSARNETRPLIEEPMATAEEPGWSDLRPVLDEEVRRLPVKYRTAVVLCYLEGKAYEEAAREIGCPKGTVSIRLTRAREMLHRRLVRRGVVLSVAALGGLLAANATPVLAAGLVDPTVRAALVYSSGEALTNVVSTEVAELVKGVVHDMFLTKVKIAAVVATALLLVGSGAGVLLHRGQAADAPPRTEAPADPAPAAKPVLDRDPLPEHALARMGGSRWRHGGNVTYIAFVPGGKELVSHSSDGKAHVWDSATGRELRSFAVSGTPVLSPDGKTLVAGEISGPSAYTVQAWDVATGKERQQIRTTESIDELLFSPDGKILAIRSMVFNAPNGITLSEPATGERRLRIATSPGPVAHNLAFSPDSQTIAGESGGTIYLWDVSTGKEQKKFKEPRGIVHALRFSPDGKTLAGQLDAGIVLWDVATEKETARLPAAKGSKCAGFAFSPDGKTLLSREGSGLRVLDLTTGKEAAAITLPKSSDRTAGLVLSPDGKTLALPLDNTILLCDRATGKLLNASSGHQGGIESVHFLPDGKTVLARDQAGSLRRWETQTGKEVQAYSIPATGELSLKWGIHRSALSSDGKKMAWAQAPSQAIRIWDVEAGKEANTIAARPQTFVSTLAFAPDGKVLASLTTHYPRDDEQMETGEVRLWETETGKQVRVVGDLNLQQGGQLRGTVRFSPDGQLLAAGGELAIAVWEVSTGKQRWQIQAGDRRFVKTLAFSADSKTLASSHQDNTISLWEVGTSQERLRIRTPDGFVRALALSPDGRTLAAGTEDKTVRLWDASNGQELARLGGHQGAVTAVAFSADGKVLVSGGADAVVLTWDVAGIHPKR